MDEFNAIDFVDGYISINQDEAIFLARFLLSILFTNGYETNAPSSRRQEKFNNNTNPFTPVFVSLEHFNTRSTCISRKG